MRVNLSVPQRRSTTDRVVCRDLAYFYYCCQEWWRGRLLLNYLTVQKSPVASPRPLDELIEVVGLQDKRTSLVRKLSGGQQRRLDVALGLAGDPELLFLDEPTTGFDPSARRSAWQLVKRLQLLGKTIFLTTHYMDEAPSDEPR